MGNCGVGIAPCKPETREIAMKDLVNVEGIPFDVLNKGITWDWETFPEFMDAAAAQALKPGYATELNGVLDVVADRFRLGNAEKARVIEAIEVALKRGTGRLNVYRL
eukprot:gene59440-79315_t